MTCIQVAALQRDSGTYLDEPEDTEDMSGFMAGFSPLDPNVRDDIEKLLKSNSRRGRK